MSPWRPDTATLYADLHAMLPAPFPDLGHLIGTLPRRLDAGCGGTGYTPGTWVGLDLSEANCRRAHARTGNRTVVGSVTALPFVRGAFDTIECSGVLHHLPGEGDMPTALAEFRRCLGVAGRLRVAVYGAGGLVPAAIRLARWLCRPLPYRWLRTIAWHLWSDDARWRADLLDVLCVPTLRRYRQAAIEHAVTAAGFTLAPRRKTVRGWRWGWLRASSWPGAPRWLHGEGWIEVEGRKPVVINPLDHEQSR